MSLGSQTDRELLKALCNGHRLALKEFMNRYAQEIRASLRSRYNFQASGGDVDDVVQHVFTRLYEECDAIKASVRAWLYQVARNYVVDLHRQGKATLTAYGKLTAHTSGGSTVPSPEETAIRREQVLRIRAALEDIEDTYREVIRLRVYDGLSFKEAGRKLGCTQNAAKMRHRVAMRRLSEAYMNRIGMED